MKNYSHCFWSFFFVGDKAKYQHPKSFALHIFSESEIDICVQPCGKIERTTKKLQVRFFVAAETFHASVNFSCHIFASCLQYQWRDMRTAL